MLYWICPECGHECSPAIRECPTCTAAEKAEPPQQASADILSLAETFQSAPPVALLSPASYRDLISAVNGHSVPVSAAVLTAEAPAEEAPASEGAIESLVKPLVESAKQPEVLPEVLSDLAPLDSLVVEPSRPTRSEPVKLAVSPVPPASKAPALVAAQGTQAEYFLPTAGLAPIGEIALRSAPPHLPKAHEQEVEPVPPRRRSVAFVRATLTGAAPSGLAWADLTKPGEVELTPVVSATSGVGMIEGSLVPLHPKAGSLAFASSRIALAGDSLSDLLYALEISAAEAMRDAIRAIQASFQDPGTALLLCAPQEIVTAPAPPAEQWLRSPKIVFTPQAPRIAEFATVTAGPQAPTLAGPCLPPQLRNFAESQGSNSRPRNKRTGTPTWMVSVLVAMGLFLGAGGVIQYLSANRDAKAASVAVAPQASEPALPAVPVVEEHPAARFVEVAGVRVVTAPNRKPQLQYLVINHSASEVTGLNVHIAVHSAESPTGTPLFRVSSVIPSLAANQSKEIRTDLDAGLKTASIPDWQSLRTEILIARQ